MNDYYTYTKFYPWRLSEEIIFLNLMSEYLNSDGSRVQEVRCAPANRHDDQNEYSNL